MIGSYPTVLFIFVRNLLAICLMVLMCGCVPLKRGGTTHYIVLGFGVVSVNSTNQVTVTAVKASVVGFMGTTSPWPKVTLGYTSFAAAAVATNAQATVEIGPHQKITITKTQ